MLALSVVGLLDAIYLTWIKLLDKELICTGVGGCDVHRNVLREALDQ